MQVGAEEHRIRDLEDPPATTSHVPACATASRTSLTKIERIAVGGQLGGVVRSNAARLRRRKVKVVDADGNVVRIGDLAEVHQKLRERVGIEFDVQDDKRPTKAECPCGRSARVRAPILSCARKRGTLAPCPPSKATQQPSSDLATRARASSQ